MPQRNCLLLNGRPALEQFAELRAHLIACLSREAAALFAEPIMTWRGDDVEIAWYAEQAGQPVALDALDPDAQGVVVDRLKAQLHAIWPLLSGPLGALLARALYVMEPDSILAVGQEPLLIHWSILADGVERQQAALDAHFASTLGRFTSQRAPSITIPAAASPALRTPPAPEAVPVESAIVEAATEGLTRRHRGLLIATAVAALVALLLTLPSILATPVAVLRSPDVLADAQKISEAMREKVERARRDLVKADCDPNGALTLPDGKQGEVPPPPIPIKGADHQQTGDMSLVARRASESVVFVFTCGDRAVWEKKNLDKDAKPYACPNLDGGKEPANPDLVVLGSGSGFFVAPKIVATNLHVVEEAKVTYVTSRFLGHAVRANVKATTAKEDDLPDFAVLDVNADSSPPPIPLSTAPALLENVVAAGFPGVVIDVDDDLKKLLHGDARAAPSLTTFPGSVTLIKYPDEPTPLIFSSAIIGHGNSGGPLLDLCAQAIGMNTLGWSGKAEDTGYKINVAQGAQALAAFLDAHKIAHETVSQPCVPSEQAALERPPTDKGPAPNTPTPEPAK